MRWFHLWLYYSEVSGLRREKIQENAYADIFMDVCLPLSISRIRGLRGTTKDISIATDEITEVRFETQVERVMVSPISASLRRVCRKKPT